MQEPMARLQNWTISSLKDFRNHFEVCLITMIFVLFLNAILHHYIDYEKNNKGHQVQSEDPLIKSIKVVGGISQSKRHHQKTLVSITCFISYLKDILCPNLQLMIARSQVNCGETEAPYK